MTKLPPPPPSSGRVHSDRNAVVRSVNTRDELALRVCLHALGLRFRLQRKLPGMRRSIDIAFVRARVAVFADGCFWHRSPQHYRAPLANAKWWDTKIGLNVDRDRDTDARLADSGWLVVRVWAHEPPEAAAARIAGLVRQRRASR